MRIKVKHIYPIVREADDYTNTLLHRQKAKNLERGKKPQTKAMKKGRKPSHPKKQKKQKQKR